MLVSDVIMVKMVSSYDTVQSSYCSRIAHQSIDPEWEDRHYQAHLMVSGHDCLLLLEALKLLLQLIVMRDLMLHELIVGFAKLTVEMASDHTFIHSCH